MLLISRVLNLLLDRKANIINAALGNDRFLTDPALKTNRDKIFNMLRDME